MKVIKEDLFFNIEQFGIESSRSKNHEPQMNVAKSVLHLNENCCKEKQNTDLTIT